MKFISRKSLTANKRVNVLLAGPPSVAKCILLMELEEFVPESEFGFGSEDTAAGLINVLFDRPPQVLLIDELDEMDKEVYSVIEQIGETRRISERKFGITRNIELDTRIFQPITISRPFRLQLNQDSKPCISSNIPKMNFWRW